MEDIKDRVEVEESFVVEEQGEDETEIELDVNGTNEDGVDANNVKDENVLDDKTRAMIRKICGPFATAIAAAGVYAIFQTSLMKDLKKKWKRLTKKKSERRLDKIREEERELLDRINKLYTDLNEEEEDGDIVIDLTENESEEANED